jgi:hypothetical protein
MIHIKQINTIYRCCTLLVGGYITVTCHFGPFLTNSASESIRNGPKRVEDNPPALAAHAYQSIGITSSGKTFTIAVCFLPGETTGDITWALERLKRLGISPGVVVSDAAHANYNSVQAVWPNIPCLLCVWHINKCIVANCKQYFTTHEEAWEEFMIGWHTLRQSRTVSEFEDRWTQFQLSYSGQTECLRYIKKEWIKEGVKERFVVAWTKEVLHFGLLVTSR